VCWSWLDRLADLPRTGYARPPPARFGDAMTNTQQHLRKPTPGQIDYLKDLAISTGESFAYPQSFAEADAQIKRLRAKKRTSYADRRRETFQIRHDLAEPRDAAAVRRSEVSGYGSDAAWSSECPDED
jgi:hypothetical protein